MKPKLRRKSLFREPIRISLLQIHNGFQAYFPYSAGLLQAYAQKYAPDKYEFAPIIYQPLSIQDAQTRLAPAQIVGFSTYIWNINRSLAIAQILKINNPNLWIIFGGPQVPDRAEEFLQQHPFIDICCHGEGERTFLKILESYPEKNWADIPGVSYLNEKGEFMTTPKAPRLTELDEFPSPYLMGVFEPLLKAYPNEQWLAAWETNRGCPFSCTFCDWGSAIQSKIYTFDLKRVFQEIEWFTSHKIEGLNCCDANFGILKRDLRIARYLALAYQETGYPKVLNLQNSKNATERVYQIHQILDEVGVNTEVTLSMQSLDPATLKAIKRENISLKSFEELQQRFSRAKIPTYTDIIMGMPGETYDSYVEGVSKVIANGQHSRLQFYHAGILPNAEMADPEYRKRYKIETTITPYNLQQIPIDDIQEKQEFIVATESMPQADWRKARVFSWLTNLLHFNYKLLQMPFVVIHHLTGISYRQLIEAFILCEEPKFSLLIAIRDFLFDKAAQVQIGESEQCDATDLTGLKDSFFLPDMYIAIKLSFTKQLLRFYQESFLLLEQVIRENNQSLPDKLLEECLNFAHLHLQLNSPIFASQALLKSDRIQLPLEYNFLELYESVLEGQPIDLSKKPTIYYKDWAGPPFTLKQKLVY